MKFRRTEFKDIADILEIVLFAREKLKADGIEQWQGDYPNAANFESDILKNSAYVLEIDGKIAGMMTVLFEVKKEYEEIDGAWFTNGAYGIINRVAVSPHFQGKGLSHLLMEEAENICTARGISSIRIDTSADNVTMLKLIDSRGYQFCGVTQGFGGLRNAYEKVIHSKVPVTNVKY